MKFSNVKTDFQVTGWCSEQPDKSRFGRIGTLLINKIEDHPKTLSYIANSLYAEGNENANPQIRMIFLLDYFQPKYNRVVSTGLQDVEKQGFQIYDDNLDYFVGLTKNDKDWLFVAKGREYMCKEGHVIVGGLPNALRIQESWYMHGPKLKDVLHFAKSEGGIIIPSHPLTKLGPMGKTVMKLIREPSGTNLGLQEKEIREFAEDWDALEARSLSMDSEQTGRVIQLVKELGIGVVNNCDGPIRSVFQDFYNSLNHEIDFSKPELWRADIKNVLRNRDYSSGFTTVRGHAKDKYEHILLNVLQSRRYF